MLIELNVEKYGKKERINAFIKHINYGKLNTATKSEIISANYISQIKYLNYKSDCINKKSLTADN